MFPDTFSAKHCVCWLSWDFGSTMQSHLYLPLGRQPQTGEVELIFLGQVGREIITKLSSTSPHYRQQYIPLTSVTLRVQPSSFSCLYTFSLKDWKGKQLRQKAKGSTRKSSQVQTEPSQCKRAQKRVHTRSGCQCLKEVFVVFIRVPTVLYSELQSCCTDTNPSLMLAG